MNSYLASRSKDPSFDHLFDKSLHEEKMSQIDKEYEVTCITCIKLF